MKYSFLGTGTSQGIPVIACHCRVCTSNNPKDKRLRTSLLIESEETTVAIDCGPDFRVQMLHENVKQLDAIVFTHEHNDHIAGLDEIRAFNYFNKRPMQIYCTERVQKALRKKFFYIFENADYPGVPQIKFHTIRLDDFRIGDITFHPIPLKHAEMPVLGFRMGDLTYISDANYIGETEKNIARNSEYLVLNALRREPHHSHFTLEEAIDLSKELKAENTFLTHISHQLGKHAEVEMELPKKVRLAFDGLQVETKKPRQ